MRLNIVFLAIFFARLKMLFIIPYLKALLIIVTMLLHFSTDRVKVRALKLGMCALKPSPQYLVVVCLSALPLRAHRYIFGKARD